MIRDSPEKFILVSEIYEPFARRLFFKWIRDEKSYSNDDVKRFALSVHGERIKQMAVFTES
ncbi:hypothetical protein J6TS1_41010 [Siminovitchia terrae]|uniref:Uncharacterized protein n=1 Tax=Siminovitchia terrae TaxID=1914933 RepID=A0ABQ4L2Y4_SIMTE|nr:hypothetical protein J22TS1_31930 [Siminovitchia terrae]GIN98231.1 hypothetical protein J6TS1_41010 [Siminovitchia terrae]